MSDDLASFPDGGRATLVRRYSPPLTVRQLAIMASCPYERPAKFDLKRHPRRLAELGLLEENPDNRGEYRLTEAGAEVLSLWRNAGFKP